MQRKFAPLLLALLAPLSAEAYRPFDNTDADTAHAGEVELEVGPAGITRTSGQTTYSPVFVGNYGFEPGYELVFEIQDQLVLGPRDGAPRHSIGALELSVKHVLREGELQEQEGPSVAIELGVYFPGVHREPGYGGIASLIVSKRFGLATVHFNGNIALERDGHFLLSPAIVAEGPDSWPVRPVTELIYSHEFAGPNEASVLAGLIWKVSESLSIDLGARAGRAAQAPLYEARGGFSIGF